MQKLQIGITEMNKLGGKDKYNVGFDGTKFTGANADLANKK